MYTKPLYIQVRQAEVDAMQPAIYPSGQRFIGYDLYRFSKADTQRTPFRNQATAFLGKGANNRFVILYAKFCDCAKCCHTPSCTRVREIAVNKG